MFLPENRIKNFKNNNNSLFQYDIENSELISNDETIKKLSNHIDLLSQLQIDFLCCYRVEEVTDIIPFIQLIFVKLSKLLLKYIPIQNKIIQAFQLIDISKQNLKNANLIFRENLLKEFSKAYNYGEGPLMSLYDKVLSTFQDITEKNENEMLLSTEGYIDDQNNLNVQKYWINGKIFY